MVETCREGLACDSFRSVCRQSRMRGSYSKTELSDKKTSTEESGKSFRDFTDTLGVEVWSKDSPVA